MSSDGTSNIVNSIQDTVLDSIFGGGENSKTIMKVVIGIVIVGLIAALIWFVWHTMSGFGNGRIVGSGCGRNNQLQRAVQFEFPLSQTEFDEYEVEKQKAAGFQYANHYNPPMENVYAGFGDKKAGVEIETYQIKPNYPQTSATMPVFNDNVLKNLAYD